MLCSLTIFLFLFRSFPQGRRGQRSPRSRLSPRGKHGTSSSTTHKKTTLLKETVYKVLITTGNQKNAGTSARVYLRMKGSKGKMTKKCLSKSKSAVKSKTQAENRRAKTKAFKFQSGATQTFKIKTADIGDIKSITLEVCAKC